MLIHHLSKVEHDVTIRELVFKSFDIFLQEFKRGTVRHFVMSVDGTLGNLNFLRIWHDNSGEGIQASWFLDKVIVEDIVARKRYFFMCGRWLAAEEDDGEVNRMLPVAGEEEISGFHHLFFTRYYIRPTYGNQRENNAFRFHVSCNTMLPKGESQFQEGNPRAKLVCEAKVSVQDSVPLL